MKAPHPDLVPISPRPRPPSALDLLWRGALWVAYRMLRLRWAIGQKSNHGVVVLVRHENRILLVGHSYRTLLSPPGGYLKPGEDPKKAAVRELAEELQLKIQDHDLRHVTDHVIRGEGRTDKTTFMEFVCQEEPRPVIDNREIVGAWWGPLERIEHLPVGPSMAAVGPSYAREVRATQDPQKS